ncbi:hypothetical protein TNCV_1113831 [Trichonephila clavipes]|nr:hypothetical protein TNCV_1113831 [Trichonephila clavipes]
MIFKIDFAEENNSTQQHERNDSNSAAGTKQLNSAAGTKQLDSAVGTKRSTLHCPSIAYNRLQPPTTAYNRLQPPTTAYNRLQPPATAYDRLRPPTTASTTACNRLRPPATAAATACTAPPLQQNRLFLPTLVAAVDKKLAFRTRERRKIFLRTDRNAGEKESSEAVLQVNSASEKESVLLIKDQTL